MKPYSNSLTEFTPQMETQDLAPERSNRAQTGGFDEHEEIELTIALLEVKDEEELEAFLGDLIRKVGKAVGQVVKATTGGAVGNVLKKVIHTALPVGGALLGGWVGGPLGAQLGKTLAATAGKSLGLELEGLSSEDREFAAARQFVRFAGETARNALGADPSDPIGAARNAMTSAGQIHAPGLVERAQAPRPTRRWTGRWARRNRNIIVFEV